jgi:hypothetical protein
MSKSTADELRRLNVISGEFLDATEERKICQPELPVGAPFNPRQ